MRIKLNKSLKITGLALFIVLLVVSLSVHEAPLLEVLPKNITVAADNGSGVVVIGLGNSVYHYLDIADKGMMTRVIFDKRDRRFVIVKLGLWSGRQLELWSSVPSGDKPSVRAYGFLSASGYLVPRLEVAGNREHAPERDPLQLLSSSKQPAHPPRSGWKWSVIDKPRRYTKIDRVKRTSRF